MPNAVIAGLMEGASARPVLYRRLSDRRDGCGLGSCRLNDRTFEWRTGRAEAYKRDAAPASDGTVSFDGLILDGVDGGLTEFSGEDQSVRP